MIISQQSGTEIKTFLEIERQVSVGRGKSKRTTCLGQYHCDETFPSGTKRCINISTEISRNFRLMGSTHRRFSTNSNFPSILLVSCFYRRLYAESESHSNYGVRHMSPLAVPIFDVYPFISWLIIFHLQLLDHHNSGYLASGHPAWKLFFFSLQYYAFHTTRR